MLKTYLAIGSLVTLSLGANAGMIERDWVSEGDKCLTYVSELNIEILDVSFTANIGHLAAANELSDGGMFSGFRFLNNAEARAIIDTYFGGMDSQFQLLPNGSDASTQVFNFLELINANIAPFGRELTFNTCEHALGCELGIPVGSDYHLKDAQRWQFTSSYLVMVDQLENSTQLLVRDVAVPEPQAWLLFSAGLLLVGLRRYTGK